MNKIFLIISVVILSGCASSGYVMKNSFSVDELDWFIAGGTTTVEGSAFLRQRGGGIVTCAGNEVNLVPVTKYSTERMTFLYENTEFGILQTGLPAILRGKLFKGGETAGAYLKYLLKTTCDVDGKFQFQNVPQGSYYLITKVEWNTGRNMFENEGGMIMKRVLVNNKELEKFIISN
tara:strand:- start:157 stop:687 length:531 start_codon:yes stop_codon:yes gene_type:complete